MLTEGHGLFLNQTHIRFALVLYIEPTLCQYPDEAKACTNDRFLWLRLADYAELIPRATSFHVERH